MEHGEKANVNKRSVSKLSPEGKTIHIRIMLQKSFSITGKLLRKQFRK